MRSMAQEQTTSLMQARTHSIVSVLIVLLMICCRELHRRAPNKRLELVCES